MLQGSCCLSEPVTSCICVLLSHKTANHLRLMQDINPQLVARLSQRLFFVVNKIDLTHTCEGLEPDEIKHYVANLVTNQLATEGFQLSPDQVGPFFSYSSLFCTLHDLLQTLKCLVAQPASDSFLTVCNNV